jgi:hypothetical protein
MAQLCISCGVGIHDNGDDDPVETFVPFTDEEARAHERIRQLIAQAERLDTAEISEAGRAQLKAAVKEAREALRAFIKLRGKGTRRDQSLSAIGAASVAILADDASGGGVVDDVLLPFCGIAAIAVIIATTAPASRDEIIEGWHRVGGRLDQLSHTIETVAPTAATQACPTPQALPELAEPPDTAVPSPSNPGQPDTRTTIDVSPAPQTDQSDDQRTRCIAQPVCPHRGGDPIHDACADEVPPNLHRGCDVLVDGKHFDALGPGRVLWEVKTERWSSYSDYLKQVTLDAHRAEAIAEHTLATACGYSFVFAVSDADLHRALTRSLGGAAGQVRHVPQCQRDLRP